MGLLRVETPAGTWPLHGSDVGGQGAQSLCNEQFRWLQAGKLFLHTRAVRELGGAEPSPRDVQPGQSEGTLMLPGERRQKTILSLAQQRLFRERPG